MRVEEMTHCRVTADQDELTEGLFCTAFLQEPEQTFDRDVHDLFRGFFACGQMNHVGDAFHGFVYKVSIGNVSRNDFKAGSLLEKPIMTQGSNASMRKPLLLEETLQKPGSDLAGGAQGEASWGLRVHSVHQPRSELCLDQPGKRLPFVRKREGPARGE